MIDPTAAPRATDLRCEYLVNPLGVDATAPRLSWRFEAPSAPRGARQGAYQIVAAASADDLADETKALWDSGKVVSADAAQIVYGGAALSAGQRVWWKVRVWNASGAASAWSEPAWWEMGLGAGAAWPAAWIGPQPREDIYVSYPAPLLRREFAVAAPIVRARLYITARGLYSARINGRRVGEDELTPGWTDYARRIQYNVYDVTDLLAEGANALAVMTADGWYSGNLADFASPHRGRYGRDPQLLAHMVIDTADDARLTVDSDEQWRWADGPIVKADLYKGETHDARLARPGWDAPGYDDSDWKAVEIYKTDEATLVAKTVEPVRIIERLTPIARTEPQPGVFIYDMGQNMVGRARVRFTADAGRTITLRHAEVLNEDGTLYTDNLRSADQTDAVTVATDGEHEWTPTFTFHGFRYLEITGLDAAPELEAIVGEVMHNAMRPTGSFECSDADLNQLQHNIVWGQKGNYLEVPTDCPQRDERLGWTGDAQVFIRTGAFNFDVAAFFTKWLADMEDARADNGSIPFVVPDVLSRPAEGRFAGDAAAWGDAAVICPWTIYLCYGDTRILETHYAMMAGWIEFQRSTSRDLVRPAEGFGDWLAMDAPGADNAQTATPKDLVGAAYFAYTTRLMARIAEILGKSDDAEKYAHLADDVVAAFQREFVTPAGRVLGDTQTAYALALNLDLLDEAHRPIAAARLAADIEAHDDHITTGFVGVNQIMFALAATGRLEHAYRLLFQDTYPSWLMPVKNGATTIWERWDGWTPDKGFQSPSMNSFNHYAYGCVGEWLSRICAGLDLDESRPGYEHIHIRPHPDPTGRMTWAKATLESIRGPIAAGWSLADGVLTVEATIPANATATVSLPTADAAAVRESGAPLEQADGVGEVRTRDGRVELEIGSGTYRFTCEG